METLFMTLLLNVQRGSSEEIWPLQGFFTVSLLLTSGSPPSDKLLLFLRCQECQMCIQLREIKVAEINAPLKLTVPKLTFQEMNVT